MIHSYFLRSLMCFPLFLLVACGGGGGGGGGLGSNQPFAPPNIPSSLVTITSSNAIDVAGAAVYGTDATVMGQSLIYGSVSIDSVAFEISTFDLATNILLDYIKEVGSMMTPSLAGVVGNESYPCDSGSYNFSYDVSNPNSDFLDSGDTITITFNNCYSSFDNSTFRGSFTFTIISGTLDLTCSDFCGNVVFSESFNNLRLTILGETLTIHGGMDVDVSNSGNIFEISGSSLYSIITGVDSIHLTDFSVYSSLSGNIETIRVSGEISSLELNGRILVDTDLANPVLFDITDDYAHMGTINIAGAGGSSLEIVILNSATVQFSLDSDGDTVPDSAPYTVDWDNI